MKRVQRKRCAGWKMPPNTNKVISNERQTYNLCHGHEDEKKNTIASHAEDTHTESHYPIVRNKNISDIIGQDATGTIRTDEKKEPKPEDKEQHTEMKSPKQERQEINGILQPSKPNCLKDLENNAHDVASRIKERSKSTTSMAVATESGNNLDGNTLRCSHASQTKNSNVNIRHSVLIATKSNVIPVRVQRKRTKGFKLQDASPNGLPVVYVGRPTKWGNPFRIGVDGDREECINQYERMLRGRTLVNNEFWLEPLRGKDLACWCSLDKPCHADIILKILEKGEK